MDDQRCVTRAITFSASHVVEGGTWQELMTTLRRLWSSATEASNFAIRHYALTDDPGMSKCPKLYAYPQLSERFPEVSTGTLATIGRNTERDYRRHRMAFWGGARALPLYRYPAPYPIRKQDWRAGLLDGQRPCVFFFTGQKKGGGIQKWQVVLSGGPGFQHQLGHFRQLLSGEARPCDLAIYRQRCGGTHRNQAGEKGAGGASRVSYRVMIKIVAKFPRRGGGEATGALLLRTDPGALWVAEHDGRVVRPWVINADEAARWLARMRDAHADHAARRRRMSEDLKLEIRTHVGKRRQMLGCLDAMCDKHRRRLNTFVRQCAAGIVNYCVRQKVACLVYDDTNREWMPSFPWSSLRTELKSRLEANGIDAGGVLLSADEESQDVEEPEATNAAS